MKGILKEILYVFLIGLVLCITSCGNNKYKNGVDDEQVLSDLQSQMPLSAYGFILQSTDIIKRQTDFDGKEDLVYISACLQNEYYKITQSFKMTYTLYNDGWILDDLAFYDNNDDYSIETIKTPTDEDLLRDITSIYSPESFELSYFPLQADCQVEQWTSDKDNLCSEWKYIYQYEYFTFEVYLKLTYNCSENYILEPTAEITGCEYFYNNNIVSTWTTHYVENNELQIVTIEISKESPDQIRVIRTRENSEYFEDYQCDIRPIYALDDTTIENPVSLQLGPIYDTYYIAIDADGLYYHCVSDNEPAYKLTKKSNDLEQTDVTGLNSVHAETEERNIEQVIASVNGYLENREIDQAEEQVESALTSYPENTVLLELYRTVLEYYPVCLENKFLTKSDFEEEKRAPYYDDSYTGHDSIGNYYEDAKRYWTSSFYSKEGEIKYNTYSLDGEYTHFTAVLSSENDWKYTSSDEGTIFYILGDENLLFSSYVDKNTDPIYIDLDITNVKELKIGIEGGKTVYLILGEANLYKRF